jgi:hypothetical protein
MPFGAVTLIPGVDVEKTPTLNQAGYSASQLIRWRDGLAQKYGGWTAFYPLAVGGVPRDLHAWEDLNTVNHLSVGTTTQLSVITNGSLQNITPQTLISNFAPNFSTVSTTPTVTIIDPNISNVTTFDSVFFDTPISVGGIILSGLYPIILIIGTHSYEITAATNATSTVNNAGAVPAFTTALGSSVVSVALTANGMTNVAPDNTIVFPIATTSNGVTIIGSYQAATITDANDFTIQTNTTATGNGSFSMNGGNAQLVYYITQGPAAIGIGYGLGAYGAGGYGTGIVPPTQTGTPITATDWTSDNWGEILLACPENGGIYFWDPTGGFSNAQLVSSAPIFNSGMFVSTTQQILITYGSTLAEQIGVEQDPMLVQWSDSGNFFNFNPTSGDLAGNYVIPIGSKIIAGIAVSNQNFIWTDLDLWIMNFIGYPDTFGFNKIGAGAGAGSKHSIMQLRGNVYWMGISNFYSYTSGGVAVIPCPVWDIVFQNLNTTFAHNIRAMPNTPFNEAGWFYPSNASASGENDSYVKFNIVEPGNPWDYGPIGALARSAWIDQSVFGPPIGASPGGVLYLHETTPDAAGQPMVASFTTGYFVLSDGETFSFVDQIIPDMTWTTSGGAGSAQIQLTFLTINFPGDTPIAYGPYTVNSQTEYISVRFRARQVAVQLLSSDLGSFWRLGKIRFRVAPSGRR